MANNPQTSSCLCGAVRFELHEVSVCHCGQYRKWMVHIVAATVRGAANRREKDTIGDYPPSPLDGTVHAWHHDMGALRRAS